MRVEVVTNIASGSVGKDAPAQAEAILAEHGVTGRVHAPSEGELTACLRDAIDAKPDAIWWWPATAPPARPPRWPVPTAR
jgi:diacylglycerol kinase family enzyme